MAWLCPCQGCKKAVKQEQDRIIEAIEEIDINSPSQLNALGLKLLILDTIRPKK
jgi:coenzyme F420-reducing hydrogenase gamma subunit